MDYFDKLDAIVKDLEKKFPNGNNPFQIVTRLCEEAGELAKEVNHFEGTGIKYEKYGEPDKTKLAKEIQDVMRCTLQVARHYGVEDELKQSIDTRYEKIGPS